MLFHELLFQVFEISKIPVSDIEDVGDVVELEVDEVVFILKNISTDTEDALEYLCDFGEPPKARREEILARLLELNSLMPMLNPPFFAIHIDNGHVVLRGKCVISGMGPLDLLNNLAACVPQAKEWKESHYLWETEPGQTSPDSGRTISDPGRAIPARANVERWMGKGPNDQTGQ